MLYCSQDNKILSMGYNGLPKGCSDDEFPWKREGEDPLETKYVYTVHSELNAILNYSSRSLAGAKLYVSLFPCNECAKAIIQSGIKEVVYDSDKYADTASVMASKQNDGLCRSSLSSISSHGKKNRNRTIKQKGLSH